MKRLYELVIELTDRCPLNCQHCSSNSGPSCTNLLSREVLEKVLIEAQHLRAQKISFGGGEPTMAPLFLDTLRSTLRHGFAAEVFTCGVVLDDTERPVSFSSDFLLELASLGDRVTLVFSFHGSCDSVHDSVTGVSHSFRCLLDSLRKSLSMGISCTANFVPTRMNAFDFAKTVSMLESIGIHKLSVLRLVPQGRGLSNRETLELSSEEEDCFVNDLVSLRGGVDLEIRTGSPFNGIVPDNNIPCRAGLNKLVVQPDGNVLPCEVFKHHGRRNWGASVYTMSLEEILDLPQFVLLQETVSDHCVICPVHSILRSQLSHQE